MRKLWLLLLIFTPFAPKAQPNLVKRIDSLLQTGISFLPIPIIYNSPETSWGAGLSSGYYFKLGNGSERNSNVQLQGVYTLRRQLITRLSGDVFGPQEGWYAYGYLSFRNYTDRFYGIGPQSALKNRLDFSFSSWEAWGAWLWCIQGSHFLGPVIRHQHLYNVIPVEALPWQTLSLEGGQGYTTTGFGLEYRFDSRNNVQSAQNGWFISSILRQHPSIYANSQAFSQVRIDVRSYLPFSPHWVWANRIMIEQFTGNPPFRELAMAGGSEFARGFFEGRFRDKSLAGLDSEIRWQTHRYLAFNLFGSIFGVNNNFDKFYGGQFHGALGMGLRLFVNPEERIALRLDIARNSEGQYGFYIDLNEAF